MLRKISHENMGHSNRGWLDSLFHFSFADYYNPANMGFGVLRVVNDDFVGGGNGFGMHPHKDMEIISYGVAGYLTHEDSLGHRGRIGRGHVQYMSAGTGIAHSEYNHEEETLRLLQIWIIPDGKGHTPAYGEFLFDWAERVNRWFHFVSPISGAAPIRIHQDANFYVTALEAGRHLEFTVEKGRQAYLVQIEGSAIINQISLGARDALEVQEEALHITAPVEDAHIMIIEMAKS